MTADIPIMSLDVFCHDIRQSCHTTPHYYIKHLCLCIYSSRLFWYDCGHSHNNNRNRNDSTAVLLTAAGDPGMTAGSAVIQSGSPIMTSKGSHHDSRQHDSRHMTAGSPVMTSVHVITSDSSSHDSSQSFHNSI